MSPDQCVGCGRDGGKDREHPDGPYCDLCWHGEEGLEIIRLRAENERLRHWIDIEGRTCPSNETINAVLKGSADV